MRRAVEAYALPCSDLASGWSLSYATGDRYMLEVLGDEEGEVGRSRWRRGMWGRLSSLP